MARTINFKSVGLTGQKVIENLDIVPSITPVGIKTPLQLGKKYGIFEMHLNLADTLADNLRNLILTNWGERLGLYFFGANLRPLTTEFSSQDFFDSEAVIRIKSAVRQWMPFVELIDYVSDFERFGNNSTAIIGLEISYAIPSLNLIDKKIKINLHVL